MHLMTNDCFIVSKEIILSYLKYKSQLSCNVDNEF